jgi:hypothetical protein
MTDPKSQDQPADSAPSSAPSGAGEPAPREAGEAAGTGEGAPLADSVRFDHAFFRRVDDIYFRADPASGEPVAVVQLGEETVVLPLDGIKREFHLAGTPDGDMLTLLAKGLKYVKALRIGDPVPPEITSRKASWEPEPRHRQIAYHRLSMQLLGWLSHDEHIITDPEELLQVAGDPTFRKKVNEAFAEAAEHLGLGRENREQVTHYLSDLAQELAYIEALRDQFKAIKAMEQKIQALRRLYGSERSVLEVADPVARLMERALADFTGQFEQADAQTGEIMAVLKNIDLQKSYIQDTRDQLHVRLMAWEDVLDDWALQAPKKSQNAVDLLHKTYHFLAPRYMPVDEWAMMTKLQDVRVVGSGGTAKRVDKRAKRLGGTMEWG